mmetsp:Transcript_12739/g.17555  ORF Transcript_12739/g.17555 Transcript_12739/m.17555 type:complete len:99 (-) Transcript_12739:195-491(-)
MHDISDLERLGIPCAALVSSEFLHQSRWQAEKLGLAGVETLLVGVEHPFSNQSLEQIRHKAENAFDSTMKALQEAKVADVTKRESDDIPVEDMGECKS